MFLDDWIKEKGHTRAWVAEKLGINPMRLHRIINDCEPTLEEVVAIDELTHRKVRLQDHLEAARKRKE